MDGQRRLSDKEQRLATLNHQIHIALEFLTEGRRYLDKNLVPDLEATLLSALKDKAELLQERD